MICKDVEGFARVLQGFVRMCKDLQGFVRICKDLQGFVRICKDLQVFVALSKMGILCSHNCPLPKIRNPPTAILQTVSTGNF